MKQLLLSILILSSINVKAQVKLVGHRQGNSVHIYPVDTITVYECSHPISGCIHPIGILPTWEQTKFPDTLAYNNAIPSQSFGFIWCPPPPSQTIQPEQKIRKDSCWRYVSLPQCETKLPDGSIIWCAVAHGKFIDCDCAEEGAILKWHMRIGNSTFKYYSDSIPSFKLVPQK